MKTVLWPPPRSAWRRASASAIALGLATPGHVAALREAGGAIRGVFAQQSIREMTRTQRSPEAVMQRRRRRPGRARLSASRGRPTPII